MFINCIHRVIIGVVVAVIVELCCIDGVLFRTNCVILWVVSVVVVAVIVLL